jgi:septum formation protein
VEYVRITAVMTKSGLILASNSPRRRELLALTGWTFTVHPADVDEDPLPDEAPDHYVLRLAESKLKAAFLGHPDQVVIAADTTVAVDGVILGKPRDAGEAKSMLRQLRGRTHQVHTGIGVQRGKVEVIDLCTTQVPMRAYTDEEIAAYVLTGDPLDKAGAYAIQHAGFHPVEGLEGCYASVMGLPLCHLTRACQHLGIFPDANVPQACQAYLQYPCPISQAVLSGARIG